MSQETNYLNVHLSGIFIRSMLELDALVPCQHFYLHRTLLSPFIVNKNLSSLTYVVIILSANNARVLVDISVQSNKANQSAAGTEVFTACKMSDC